jgi:putative acetyltransferase
MSDMIIRHEDPGQADIVPLLEDGERNSAELYPAESNHHLPLEALRAADVRFFVGRDGAGRPLATGAIVLHGEWVEIKRMWVVPQARGCGLSKAIIARLITEAKRHGATVARLETGVASHAALALYKAAGFAEREPFADYRPDPLSVFMEKRLT